MNRTPRAPLPAPVRALLRNFRAQRPLRGGSLLITVFGDSIAPRGGAVTLGSLIRLAAPFGLTERLVRTSVARLARQGWLAGKRSGRRSEYRLTRTGAERFAQATRRIYGESPSLWDGKWTLVVVPPATAFLIRTLLIHEYRKIHLRDPLLPPALLPPHWVGARAYQVCGSLYARVFPAAERYLSASAHRLHRPLPVAHPAVHARFGGIARLTRLAAPKRKIRFGVLRGKIKVADDFDTPLPQQAQAAFERRAHSDRKR